MNLPDLDGATLDRETARDDAPTWSDLDAPPKRVRLPVVQDRGARQGERARTISIKRLSKRELERGRMLFPEVTVDRPRRREDCLHGEHAERPCPFVSCAHHLYLDVSEQTGSIKLNFPDLEVWELPETCALDVADRGGFTLEEVSDVMNLTRERVRQLQNRGLEVLSLLGELSAWSDHESSGTGSEHHGACRAPDLRDLRAVRFSSPTPVARAEWRAPRPTDAALERDAEYLRLVATNARALDPRALRGPGAAVCGPVHRVPATRWREAPEDMGPASRHPLDEAREALDAQETAR